MSFYHWPKTVIPKKKPLLPMVLDNFRFGLNTVLPPSSIRPDEASSLVNFKILPLGSLETREGLTRYTSSALPNPASYIASFIFDVDSADFHLFADTDDRAWENSANREWQTEEPASSGKDELIVTQPDNKVYLLDDNKAPVEIGTLEGDATIIPFGGKAFICDGSYLKYWNKPTETILMAYDDGSGTTGYQHDNTTLTADTGLKLYAGSNTKAGIKFETQSWDSGYTITATAVEAYLRKVGSPTGNVGCELYTNAGVLIATSITVIAAADINTASEKLTFVFDTGAMSQATIYWAVITYSGGDVTNYIQFECDTVASDGDGKYYDGTWHDDTAKIGLTAIKPGRPPRARFGLIQNSRLYLSGDPFKKGVVWYSNANAFFDWSTANGGGYIGVIDNNVTNFPVGAMISFYGDIYIFGQQSQPYLCKLLGSDPSDYSLPPMFQRIYSTHKTALNVINDCWFGNESGINALSGVEQYGDLRTFFESEAVADRIANYWTDDDSFAGYNGATGQYFLKLPGCARCLVAHTKAPVSDRRGKVRYPWTEYTFVKEGSLPLEPTAFANYDNTFFIACDDKYIYKLDSTVQKDNSVAVPYMLGTKLFESPYNSVCLEKYDVSVGTDATGATLDLEVYDSAVSIDTIDSIFADASFTINIGLDFNRDLNANYKKFMVALRNIDPDGESLRINNISLITRALNR